MPRGDRMRYCVYLAFALALAFPGYAQTSRNLDQPDNDRAPSQSGTAGDNRSNKDENRPSDGAGEEFFNAFPSDPENTYPYTDPQSYHEARRAYQDLNAQRDMAYWAKGMFWATFASVVVTTFGVILVYYTLKETKRLRVEAEKTTRAALDAARFSDEGAKATLKAAEAALEANRQGREAFIAEQRPWLKIADILPRSVLTWLADGAHLEIGVLIENVGRTPARFAIVNVGVEPYCDNISQSEIYVNMVKFGRARTDTDGHVVYPGDPIEVRHSVTIEGSSMEIRERRPVLILCASYLNPIDGRVHQTGAVAQIEQKVTYREKPVRLGVGSEVRIEPENLQIIFLPAGSMVID